MQHVNQWFGYLSDAEKTATLYTLLQHSSQVQIRFFIHLLQEMSKPKPNPLSNRGNWLFCKWSLLPFTHCIHIKLPKEHPL
jgi:hypothetical protein